LDIIGDRYSERVIGNVLRFGSQLANAQSAVFFWLDDQFEFSATDEFNMPGDFISQYLREIRSVDPLATRELSQRKARVEMLHGDAARSSGSWSNYVNYLESHGFGDEVDMLLWSGDRPVAGMAMFRPVDKTAPFAADHRDWGGIQVHLEHMIQMHCKVRADRVRLSLAGRYGLQPREIELTGILVQGARNAEIAAAMGISVSTVKTHIVNILDKMGVHSRAEIAACINYLQFD